MEHVSIHASARDATHRAAGGGLALDVSIHASARDATEEQASALTGGSFNPRVRAGRDQEINKDSVLVLFQSTRPRGTRLLRSFISPNPFMFQSTRPRGTRRAMEP